MTELAPSVTAIEQVTTTTTSEEVIVGGGGSASIVEAVSVTAVTIEKEDTKKTIVVVEEVNAVETDDPEVFFGDEPEPDEKEGRGPAGTTVKGLNNNTKGKPK